MRFLKCFSGLMATIILPLAFSVQAQDRKDLILKDYRSGDEVVIAGKKVKLVVQTTYGPEDNNGGALSGEIGVLARMYLINRFIHMVDKAFMDGLSKNSDTVQLNLNSISELIIEDCLAGSPNRFYVSPADWIDGRAHTKLSLCVYEGLVQVGERDVRDDFERNERSLPETISRGVSSQSSPNLMDNQIHSIDKR